MGIGVLLLFLGLAYWGFDAVNNDDDDQQTVSDDTTNGNPDPTSPDSDLIDPTVTDLDLVAPPPPDPYDLSLTTRIDAGEGVAGTAFQSETDFRPGQSGNDTFVVQAQPGLNPTAYELYGSSGSDTFDVQAGVRIFPGTPALQGDPDIDTIVAHISADDIAELGKQGYQNDLLQSLRYAAPTADQVAEPSDAALFVNLTDAADNLTLEIASDVEGFVHAFVFDVQVDDGGDPDLAGSDTQYLTYVLTQTPETPTAVEVFGQTTVDPETGEATRTSGTGSVLAIVQIGENGPDGVNEAPDILINRTVNSFQAVSLDYVIDRSVTDSAETPPLPDRPGDTVTVTTQSTTLTGTEQDDYVRMTPSDDANTPYTVLQGRGGSDTFEVSGGAAVFGNEYDRFLPLLTNDFAADTVLARLNESDLQNLPGDSDPVFADRPLIEPAALNVDLLDTSDAVSIQLDDDVTGFIHQVETSVSTRADPDFNGDIYDATYTTYLRTDSAEPPDVSDGVFDQPDIDVVAAVMVGIETYDRSFDTNGVSSDKFVNATFNSDPQVAINRPISSIQTTAEPVT